MIQRRVSAHTVRTLAELVDRLGGIPLERIWVQPPLGTAKEKDVVAAQEGAEKRLCELVDGVLVEKGMGFKESLLATILSQILWNFVEKHDLGIVLGADALLRLMPGLVRIPDVCFISWERFPGRRIPDEAIGTVMPELAVEVLSPSNTKKEMERKLRDYFAAGVRLAWLIDPRKQTAAVYTAPDEVRTLQKHQTLDGGDVLPGFRLPLRRLFARLGS